MISSTLKPDISGSSEDVHVKVTETARYETSVCYRSGARQRRFVWHAHVIWLRTKRGNYSDKLGRSETTFPARNSSLTYLRVQ